LTGSTVYLPAGLYSNSMGHQFTYNVQIHQLGYEPFYGYESMATVSNLVGGALSVVICASVLWERKYLSLFVVITASIVLLAMFARELRFGEAGGYVSTVIGYTLSLILVSAVIRVMNGNEI